MEKYCNSCKKVTDNKDSIVKRTKLNRLVFYQLVLFATTKNRGLLKIKKSIQQLFNKMNEIVNKFLLTGDRFMSSAGSWSFNYDS